MPNQQTSRPSHRLSHEPAFSSHSRSSIVAYGLTVDFNAMTCRCGLYEHNPVVNRRLRNGGPDQVRTDDLLNAIEALFQLSYEPIHLCEGKKTRFFRAEGKSF
jgi:hypothetical protein